MQSEMKIDPSSTVNEIIARYPAAIAVLNRFGLDTCCGGAAPISVAARRDGADLDALMTALQTATAVQGVRVVEKR